MTRSEPDYEVVALRRALDECRQHHADTVAGLDPHTGPAATVGFRDRERGRAMTEQARREVEADHHELRFPPPPDGLFGSSPATVSA